MAMATYTISRFSNLLKTNLGKKMRTSQNGQLEETYLCSSNTIDETHLLKALVTEGHSHLPSIADLFVNQFDLVANVICLVLDVKINVVLETLHLKS